MHAVPVVSYFRAATTPKWRRRFTAVAVGGASVRALGVLGSRNPQAASTSPSVSPQSWWESRKHQRMTDLFIFLNVLVFVLDLLSGSQLKVLGAKHNASIVAGEWWRLSTSNFLHGGILHLFMNMFALQNMASVEMVLGAPLYAFIYLTSGFAGAFASFLFSPFPSLGASGAVLGIFGAFWMYFENNKPYLSRGAKEVQKNIQQVILANLAIGFFIAKVDNWGHGGGFLCGLILAYLFGPRMIPWDGKDKQKKLGPKKLMNSPRLPWFMEHQAFTKTSRA